VTAVPPPRPAPASGGPVLLPLALFVSLQNRVAGRDPERGDVPGWVMITVMTAALVLAILIPFREAIVAAVTTGGFCDVLEVAKPRLSLSLARRRLRMGGPDDAHTAVSRHQSLTIDEKARVSEAMSDRRAWYISGTRGAEGRVCTD